MFRFLLTLLCCLIHIASATFPELPPPLPDDSLIKVESDSNSQDKEILQQSQEAKSTDKPQLSEDDTEDADSFIDLGDKSLPVAESEDGVSAPVFKQDNSAPPIVQSEEVKKTPEEEIISIDKAPPQSMSVDNGTTKQSEEPSAKVDVSDSKSNVNNEQKATEDKIVPAANLLVPEAKDIMAPKENIKEVTAEPVKQDKQKSADIPANLLDKAASLKEKQIQKDNIIAEKSKSQKNKPNSNMSDSSSELPNVEQMRFVVNEAQVIEMPNDDVVCGELSEDAKLDQIEYNEYISLFEIAEKNSKLSKQSLAIRKFIEQYDNFQYKALPKQVGISDLVESVRKNDLSTLRVLIDNYPYLKQKSTDNGNTLLHIAALSNSYLLTKFLLIRGVNPMLLNFRSETALDIAGKEENNPIIQLFYEARMKR